MSEQLQRKCSAVDRTDKVPHDWKKGGVVIIKLPKKGDLTICCNNRSINLLSIAGKVFCTIILLPIRDASDKRQDLSELQSRMRRLQCQQRIDNCGKDCLGAMQTRPTTALERGKAPSTRTILCNILYLTIFICHTSPPLSPSRHTSPPFSPHSSIPLCHYPSCSVAQKWVPFPRCKLAHSRSTFSLESLSLSICLLSSSMKHNVNNIRYSATDSFFQEEL